LTIQDAKLKNRLMNLKVLDRWVFILILSIFVSMIYKRITTRFFETYFWWDEAGQFWMSLGQTHVSEFLTQPENVMNGVEAGRNLYNLDPIGFTILFRFWIDVFGTSPASLRSLPLMFFVFSFIACTFIGRKVFKTPLTLAALVPLFALAEIMPLQKSTEIRAYSAELFFVIVILGLTLLYVQNEKNLILVLLFFIGVMGLVFSRYSLMLAIAASCSTIFISKVIIHRQKIRKNLLFIVTWAATTLTFVAWNTGVISSANQQPPRYYTSEFNLENNFNFNFIIKIIHMNFFSGIHQYTGLFIICSSLILISSYLIRGNKNRLLLLQSLVRQSIWINCLVMIISYEVFAMALSSLGLTPWWAERPWSIGLIGIAIFSGFALYWSLKHIYDLTLRYKFQCRVINSRNYLKLVSVCTVLLCVPGLSNLSYVFQPGNQADLQTNFSPSIYSAMMNVPKSDQSNWYISGYYWPSFRMIWETEIQTKPDTQPSFAAPIIPKFYSTDLEESQVVRGLARCNPGTSQFFLFKGSASAQIEVLKESSKKNGCGLFQLPNSMGDAFVVLR
jgi:hypothetical protein